MSPHRGKAECLIEPRHAQGRRAFAEVEEPEVRQAVAHSPSLLQLRIEVQGRGVVPIGRRSVVPNRRQSVACVRFGHEAAVARPAGSGERLFGVDHCLSIVALEGLYGTETRKDVRTKGFVADFSRQAETYVQSGGRRLITFHVQEFSEHEETLREESLRNL